MMRRPFVITGLGLAAVGLAVPAYAAWQSTGTGVAKATATSLGAASAGSAGDATTTSLDLSWTSPTNPAPASFAITREGSAITCDFDAANLGTAKCRDTFASSTSARTFAYVVTPKLGSNWSGSSVNFFGSPTTAGTPPAQLAGPTLTSGSDTGSSNGDRITKDNTPTISGTGAVAGATVKVYVDNTNANGGPDYTTTALSDGSWSVTTTTMTDGIHTFAAKQTTAKGTSTASGQLSITVDIVAPSAPVITAPAAGATSVNKSSAVSGTASEAGGTVTVKVTSSGDTTGKTGTATPAATTPYGWSATLSGNMTNNQEQTATATHTDVAGNVSPASANRVFTT